MIVAVLAVVALFTLHSQALVLPDFEQLAIRLAEDETYEPHQSDETCSSKIAIVGSGITGAIAAFRLYEGFRAQELPDRQPCITVFERNPVVGGRITEAYVYDDAQYPIDTCTDTFSLSDRCLANAVEDVGLFVSPELINRPLAGFGVWNGTDLVYVDRDSPRDAFLWPYYKQQRLIDRYKFNPLNFDANASTARVNFDLVLGVPDVLVIPQPPPPQSPPRRNLSDELHLANLHRLVQNPLCYEYEEFEFISEEAGRRFASELVLPGIRERYFTNGLEFNLLEAYLGFDEGLPSSIEGGNLRLIERLLKLSGADVRLNTIVQRIEDGSSKFGLDGLLISSISASEGGSTDTERFDTVILATSLDRGNITFEPAIKDQPGLRQEYRDSIVTHFTTSGRINHEYFNWSSFNDMPQNILTAEACDFGALNCTAPPFFSLTFLREVVRPSEPAKIEKLFKIASREDVSEDQILRYIIAEDGRGIPEISWFHREFLPQSVPITRADREEPCRSILEDIEIAPRIYYAGGGEQVIASAEFGCRMADNVANTLLFENIDRE